MKHCICETCGTFCDLSPAEKQPCCPVCGGRLPYFPIKRTVRKTNPNVELPRGPNGPGVARTTEYKRWRGMLNRCHNPESACFKDYGARGIIVCDRWRKSFFAFLKDMGKAPKGLTLERIDNNGNYEPNNCRWASFREQSRNKRNNKIVKINGKQKILTDACEDLNLPRSTIAMRLRAGWDPVKAICTPIKKIRKSSPAREVTTCGA